MNYLNPQTFGSVSFFTTMNTHLFWYYLKPCIIMNESFFTTHRILSRVDYNTKTRGQKLSRSKSRISKKLEMGLVTMSTATWIMIFMSCWFLSCTFGTFVWTCRWEKPYPTRDTFLICHGIFKKSLYLLNAHFVI